MKLYRLVNGMTMILLIICTLLVLHIINQTHGFDYENLAIGNDTTSGKNGTRNNEIFGNIMQETVSVSQFIEILNRPLFVEGRMPDEEEQAEELQESRAQPLKLKLEGIVIGLDSRVAVVRDMTNNNLLRIAEGMTHNGWKVEKVNKKSVDFKRDEETQSIELEIVVDIAEKAKTSGFKLPVQPQDNRPSPRRRKQ
jgi:hypothetical protein